MTTIITENKDLSANLPENIRKSEPYEKSNTPSPDLKDRYELAEATTLSTSPTIQHPVFYKRKIQPDEDTLSLAFHMEEVFKALDFSLNPRHNKEAIHETYRRRADAAEQVARLMGKRAVAMQHRINQENNEWGRVLEKNLRSNEILLMDLLKFPDQGKKAGNPYDPSGILSQNMALLHVLRILFHRSYDMFFDPVNASAKQSERFLEEFSPESYLNTRINPALYEQQHDEFDSWLVTLTEKNPSFLKKLTDRIAGLSFEETKFPMDIFFLEMNEAEYFQYFIASEQAMPKLIDLIGTLRSWTNGYHGRYLIRFKAFQDQDEIRELAANGEKIAPDSYYSRYVHLMSEKRFRISILPILSEALAPTKNSSCQFTSEEAMALLDSFAKTSFHHYLPSWLFFIIEHRFIKANGEEDLLPMQTAFSLFSQTPFPRDLVEKIFIERGYLEKFSQPEKPGRPKKKSRKEITARLATLSLKHLPQLTNTVRANNHYSGSTALPHPMTNTKLRRQIPERKIEKLSIQFEHWTPVPGEYRRYKSLAKKMLQSKKPEALQLILNAALNHEKVLFPRNAPLAPLFPGLVGQLVTKKILGKALANLTTVSGKRKNATLFSKLLLSWARNHDINLTKVFGEALSHYETPVALAKIQQDLQQNKSDLQRLQEKILPLVAQVEAGLGDPASETRRDHLAEEIKKLEEEKRRLEKLREQKMVEIKSDPKTLPEQAMFQIIDSIYNAIRRQYLKGILIAGGEMTAKMVEEYLTQNLIPQKNRQRTFLLSSPENSTVSFQNAPDETQRQIDFLFDVLAGIESDSAR